MTTDQRDITVRLRSRAWDDREHRQLREEAAREIERLRAVIDDATRGYLPQSAPDVSGSNSTTEKNDG